MVTSQGAAGGAHDDAVEFVVLSPPDDVVGRHHPFFQDGGRLEALGLKLGHGRIQPLLVFGPKLVLDVDERFVHNVTGHRNHGHKGDLGSLFFGQLQGTGHRFLTVLGAVNGYQHFHNKSSLESLLMTSCEKFLKK
jgi:hypothetical protein